MRLSVQDALTALRITTTPITRALIRSHYQRLASQYHPDKNVNGLHEMQTINIAYDVLCRTPESVFILHGAHKTTGDKVAEHRRKHTAKFKDLDLLRLLGLDVDETGMKIWVYGDTYEHRETLKEYGFSWCPEDRGWWAYK